MGFLVTGATGTTGRGVVRELLADADHEVRAGTRSPDRYDGPDAATPVRFDFTDPTSYGAFADCDGVFLVRPPAMGRVERDLFPAIDAMERAGVQRVTVLSVLGADRVPILPHRRIERRVESSSLDYAFLRAAYFMQNLAAVHAADVRGGELVVPAGDGRVAMVDARDVAAVGARTLLDAGGRRTLDLTGPFALDFHEAARTFSQVLGFDVEYTNPSFPTFVGEMRARGVPTGLTLAMCGVYAPTRLGLTGRVGDGVEELLGRRPRSFERFVGDYRDVWT
ncbi:NAD(P)H-binding protein [Halomarina oriensis]|nr:NAD(P)H-binding protein [Halomarina oriensis]